MMRTTFGIAHVMLRHVKNKRKVWECPITLPLLCMRGHRWCTGYYCRYGSARLRPSTNARFQIKTRMRYLRSKRPYQGQPLSGMIVLQAGSVRWHARVGQSFYLAGWPVHPYSNACMNVHLHCRDAIVRFGPQYGSKIVDKSAYSDMQVFRVVRITANHTIWIKNFRQIQICITK